MHRIYVPETDLSQETITIVERTEIHHLRSVLRLKPTDEVIVFNGRGQEARGTIDAVSAGQATIKIDSVKNFPSRIPALILACAVPKRSKFELIVEKAAELGAAEIIPLRTERGSVDFKLGQVEKKVIRFTSVAVSAAKQCGRSTIPRIHPPSDFASALAELRKDTVLFIPSLSGDRKNILEAFANVLSPQRIAFFIGPEGDFSPAEYALAGDSGCIPVSLGEYVLRVETAALCALACARQYYHRD